MNIIVVVVVLLPFIWLTAQLLLDKPRVRTEHAIVAYIIMVGGLHVFNVVDFSVLLNSPTHAATSMPTSVPTEELAGIIENQNETITELQARLHELESENQHRFISSAITIGKWTLISIAALAILTLFARTLLRKNEDDLPKRRREVRV